MSIQAQNYVTAPLNFKELMNKAINDYILWLEQLYGKGVFVNYYITDLNIESKTTE